MKGIAQYDRAQLDALIADTRRESGGGDFAPAYLQGIRQQILEHPNIYRSFGPYWWLLKRELIAAGVRDFGESVDTETVEGLDYGDRAVNLAACYVFQAHAFENMAVYGHRHTVELVDGTVTEYVLADEEVEAIEVGRLVRAGLAQVQ